NAPSGIRTRATALKGPRPGPLVDGGPRPAYFRRSLSRAVGRKGSGAPFGAPLTCLLKPRYGCAVFLRARFHGLRNALTQCVGLGAVLAVLVLERSRVGRPLGLARLDRVEDVRVGGVVGGLRLRRDALAERVLASLAGAVELVERLAAVV